MALLPRSAVVKGRLFHFLYFFLFFFLPLVASPLFADEDALYSDGGSHVIATDVEVSADASG